MQGEPHEQRKAVRGSCQCINRAGNPGVLVGSCDCLSWIIQWIGRDLKPATEGPCVWSLIKWIVWVEGFIYWSRNGEVVQDPSDFTRC
jgi:hypothetical protein